MTENFALSHGCRPGQVRVGYVGTCQLGVEARIDANGELLVRSPGQMLGYYKLPELAGKADARAELTGKLLSMNIRKELSRTGCAPTPRR
ncbi:MAG: hypothetical protein ACYCZD_00850 [Rhodanobacter sp.]